MLNELPSSHPSVAHCPLLFSTLLKRARSKWSKRRQVFHHTGSGHQYIADAAARSIRDGKTEHELNSGASRQACLRWRYSMTRR